MAEVVLGRGARPRATSPMPRSARDLDCLAKAFVAGLGEHSRDEPVQRRRSADDARESRGVLHQHFGEQRDDVLADEHGATRETLEEDAAE